MAETRDLDLSAADRMPSLPARPQDAEAALEAFIATGLSEHTRKARLGDLAALGRWVVARTGGRFPEDARGLGVIGAEALMAPVRGHAQAAAEAFLAEGCGALSPASRNRIRSTIRAFLRAARRWGLTEHVIDLPGEPSKNYRDTRGPGEEAIVRLWAAALEGDDARSRRDAALLGLLYGLGLRASEVLSLDLEHLDAPRKTISVAQKKGGGQRRNLSLPAEVLAAIARWLDVRGDAAGPLFIALADGGRGRLPKIPAAGTYHRMPRSGLERVVRRWSQLSGAKVRPHGLRHSAITACLDAGHDVRHVSRFARHASVATTILYDDNRTDINGKVAAAHVARLEAARKMLQAETDPGTHPEGHPGE